MYVHLCPSASFYNRATNLQGLHIYNMEVAVSAHLLASKDRRDAALLEVAYGDADAQIPLHAQGNPCRA
jgi:hypothetical protein